MATQIIVLPTLAGAFTFRGTTAAISAATAGQLTVDKFIGIEIILIGTNNTRTKTRTTVIYSGGLGSLASVQPSYSPSILNPRIITVAVSIFNDSATRNCTTTFDVSKDIKSTYALDYRLLKARSGPDGPS